MKGGVKNKQQIRESHTGGLLGMIGGKYQVWEGLTMSETGSHFNYSCISRGHDLGLKIWCEKLGLYASIYGTYFEPPRKQN